MEPGRGRFWRQDEYEGENGDPLSLHRYLYCVADPVNQIDPSGNATLAEVALGVTVIGLESAIAIPQVTQVIYNGATTLWNLLLVEDLRSIDSQLQALPVKLFGAYIAYNTKHTKDVVEGLLNQAEIHAAKIQNFGGSGGPGGKDPRGHWKDEIKAFLQRAKNLVTKRLKGSSGQNYLKQINDIAEKTDITLD